jgi:hypothetical protein
MEYIGRNIFDPERRANCVAALKRLARKGVSVRRNYLSFPSDMVQKSIMGNRKVVRSELEERSFLGGSYYRKSRMPTTDVFMRHFGWLTKVKFITGDVIPEDNVCHVAGLDPVLETIVRSLGPKEGKDFFISIKRIIERMIPFDPGFPKHITAEEIIAEISKTNVSYWDNRIIDVLVVLGFSSEAAGNILAKINSIQGGFSLAAMNYVSFAGSITQMVEMGDANQHRVVELMTTGDQILNSILRNLAFAFTIANTYLTGVVNYISVYLSDEALAEVLGDFHDRKNRYRGLRFMSFRTDIRPTLSLMADLQD